MYREVHSHDFSGIHPNRDRTCTQQQPEQASVTRAVPERTPHPNNPMGIGQRARATACSYSRSLSRIARATPQRTWHRAMRTSTARATAKR